MTQGLVHFFPIFWPVRNKTWPSKNFCPPSKNYFEAWKNSKSTSFGLEDPYIIAFIGESPSSLSLPPTYHLVPNQVDSFMFSFNLFLSWPFCAGWRWLLDNNYAPVTEQLHCSCCAIKWDCSYSRTCMYILYLYNIMLVYVVSSRQGTVVL